MRNNISNPNRNLVSSPQKECASGRSGRAFGFTLIELLVVIAIISVLATMLIPALTHAKELARTSICASQLRTLGIAQVAYTTDNNGQFTLFEDLGSPSLLGIQKAWVDFLSPYIEAEDPSYPGYLEGRRGLDTISMCPTKEYRPAEYTTTSGSKGSRDFVIPDALIWWNRVTEYAMNAQLSLRVLPGGAEQVLGPESVSSDSILNSSSTLLYVDSHFTQPWIINWSATAVSDTVLSAVHYRHNSAANVAFVDGHAETVERNGNQPMESVAHDTVTGWLLSPQ